MTKETYYKRKEQGLCTYCGKRPADHGTYCEECARKNNERSRKRKQSEAYQKKKKEKIKNGICLSCGKPNDRVDSTFCSKCTEKREARRERLRIERIAQQKCVRCGNDTDGIHRLCEECSAKNRQSAKEVREYYKSQGICVSCRMRKAVKGKTKCMVCAQDCNESRRKYYTAHKTEILNKVDNAKVRSRYAELKAQGICVRCHTKKARAGYTTCVECANKDNRRRRAAYRKARGDLPTYDEALEQGLCVECKKNNATHGKLCATCYDNAVRNLPKKRPRGTEHYWIQDNRIAFLSYTQKRARA